MAHDVWRLGLSSWIIQDGNYGDFSVSEQVELAVEFGPTATPLPTASRTKAAVLIGESRYKIDAQVVFVAEDVWVLDFGILAFQEAKPPEEFAVGDWVNAEIYLGVDPFFYFERLHALPGMPPLIYTWVLREIDLDTTPWLEARNALGQKVLSRDETKRACKSVSATRAWDDDAGHAEYVLTCERLDIAPKTESATAT
jgi:hypothetical protein